jgi:hypothetical protein
MATTASRRLGAISAMGTMIRFTSSCSRVMSLPFRSYTKVVCGPIGIRGMEMSV